MPGRACRSACRPWPTRWARCCAVLAPLLAADRGACLRRRAIARRRHDRAGAGQGQDRSPGDVGFMCATTGRLAGRTRRRRCSITRAIAAASIRRPASGRLCRDPPGRCLWRLQQAVRGRPQAGADHRGGLLGACPPAVLRPGRSRGQCPAQGAGQNGQRDLAAGAGGGPAHRRAVRHRARDQRPERRASAGRCGRN